MRVALVQVVAGDVDHAGLVEEARVDRLRRPRRRVEALLDVQQQDLAQLRHRLGGPVVAAHQRLAGAHRQALAVGRERAVAKRLGHGGLQVEHQAVFAPPGQHVQARADRAEHGFVALDLAHLERRGQAAGGQLLPVAAQARRLRHPQHHLQVAQAARATPCSWARARRGCFRTCCGAGASPASWRPGRPAGPGARGTAAGSRRTARRCRTAGAPPAARSAPSRPGPPRRCTRPRCARWSRFRGRRPSSCG